MRTGWVRLRRRRARGNLALARDSQKDDAFFFSLSEGSIADLDRKRESRDVSFFSCANRDVGRNERGKRTNEPTTYQPSRPRTPPLGVEMLRLL